MPPLEPEGPRPEPQREAQADEPGRSYERGASPRPAAPYFSPPPNLQPTSDAADSPPSKKNSPRQFVGLGLIIAAALVGGAWYALSPGASPSPDVPTATAPSELKKWHVTGADFDQKATDQLKAMLSGAAAATDDDLNAQNAPALRQLAEKSPEMAAEIESNQRRLYRVYLLDFLAQDGDFVELFVDGVSFGDINLSNAGTSILIPVAPGKPIDLNMVAKVDGGGGVTVAFVSSAGEARTSVLAVGQFEQWQVALQ